MAKAFQDLLKYRDIPIIFDLSIKKCDGCRYDRPLCLDCFTRYQKKLDYNKARFAMCANMCKWNGRPFHKMCTTFLCFCWYTDMLLAYK